MAVHLGLLGQGGRTGLEKVGSCLGPDHSGLGGHDKESGFDSRSTKTLADCSQNLICVFRSSLWLPWVAAIVVRERVKFPF